MSVTPLPGAAAQVTTGGTPVDAVPALTGGIGGCFITNPASAADQGVDPPESIFVSPVADATLQATDTTFEIFPGSTWEGIAGQTTRTSVNAATSGHRFSVTYWLPEA